MNSRLPALSEIEISLFGPGYGEAAVVHLGDNEWLTIDSCINSRTGEVVPVEYLSGLGVELERDVKHIVASHWHDDHVRGLSQLVAACPGARFWCAHAMTNSEFLKYVALHASASTGPATKGTSEIFNVFRLLKERGRRRDIIAPNVMLHQNPHSAVFALSPSAARFDDFLAALAKKMPSVKEPQRRARKLTPNHLAVAMWLPLACDGVLLGADVEEARVHGWSLILEEQTCIHALASVFKIPHHGSENAHHQRVWEELCDAKVLGVLAPYVLAATQLPKRSDVERIMALTEQAYATASLGARAPRRYPPPVEKEFKDHRIRLRAAQPPTGHVRLRRIEGGSEPWRVELRSSAVPLDRVHGT